MHKPRRLHPKPGGVQTSTSGLSNESSLLNIQTKRAPLNASSQQTITSHVISPTTTTTNGFNTSNINSSNTIPTTASSSSNNSGSFSGYRKYVLMVHEKDFSEQEIIVNGKVLNWLQLGDILEITQPKTPPNSNPVNENPISSSPISSIPIIPVSAQPSTPIDISSSNQNLIENNNFSSSPFSSSFRERNLSGSNRAPTPPTIGSAKQAPSVGNVTSNNTQQQGIGNSQQSNNSNKAFIVKIPSLETTKGIQYISILKSIADIFEFQPRRDVYLRVMSKEHAMLDYVVFSLRDHFLSRSDMWRFSLYLNDTSVYESKALTWHGGIRVYVKELMKESVGKVSSGLIVYGHTKITYRSKSAVIYWLFQMSREMWEYDEYGNLNFERVINGFIRTVFDQWREVGVNHSLSIVLFSRQFLTDDEQHNSFTENGEEDMASLGNKTNIFHSILGSKDGRKYVDFYKIVDWSETQRTRSQFIRVRLRSEFLQFQSYIEGVCQKEQVSLTNSSAVDGNFMEAINLVLNSFDKYYINRDLTRTGQVILLVSPGSGLFNVQVPILGKITTKRLMDVGLSVDLIALAVPPLHSVPIFRYKKKEVGFSNNSESPSTKEYTYYRSPDWINITFYRENYFRNDINQDNDDCECTDGATNLFLPLSRMPNLESLPTNIPLFEKYWHNIQSVSINNNSSNQHLSTTLGDHFRQHDDQVFKVFQSSRQQTTNNRKSDSFHGTPKKKDDKLVTDSSVNSSNMTSPKSHFLFEPHLEDLRNSEQHHLTGTSASSTGTVPNESFNEQQSMSNEGNSFTVSNNATQHHQITHHSSNSQHNAQHNNSLFRRQSPHSQTPFMAEFAERHKVKELFYMKLFNPFHMDSETFSSPGALQSNNQQNTFHRRRWGHLHPSFGLRPTQKSEYIKYFLLNVNWQGVSEPACLPLTTDYWPESALKILNDFDLHTHNITDTNNIYQNISTLVRELVCQRLHQGFQLYNDDFPKDPLTNAIIQLSMEEASSTDIDVTSVKEAESETNTSISSNTTTDTTSKKGRGGRMIRGRGGSLRGRRIAPTTHTTSADLLSMPCHENPTKTQKSRPQKMEYCLSSANQFHRIIYNPNISNMITIERYVPKVTKNEKSINTSSNNISSLASSNKSDGADPFNNAKSTYTYRYMLWNPTLDSYESRITRFNSSVDYNWNKLDYLICGDHNQMTDELHNRSLQFHVVPIMNSNKHLFSSTTQLFGAFNNNSSYNSSSNSPSSIAGSSSGDLFSQPNSNEYSERIKSFKKFRDALVNRNFKAIDCDGIEVTVIGEESGKDSPLPLIPFKTAKLQYVPQEGGIDDYSRIEWLNIVYKATFHPAEFWSFKVQWLVCTASLIDEFLQSLARRARQCGFAMVQTPAEIDSYTNFIHASKQAADRLLQGSIKQGIDPLENVHPFRSYVRIPLSTFEIMYNIRNAVCEAPFNFVPDSYQRKLSKRFIHNSGCIILHIDVIKGTDNALITWIDNPFQTFDLSIAPTVKQNEILTMLRKLVWIESTSNPRPTQTGNIFNTSTQSGVED